MLVEKSGDKSVSYTNAISQTKIDEMLLCNHTSKWEIRDDESVLYAGDQNEMEEIFEFLTVPLGELVKRYPERGSQKLKNHYKLFKIDWIGEIRLVEIHQRFSKPRH